MKTRFLICLFITLGLGLDVRAVEPISIGTSPTFTAPVLGAATGTSVALNGVTAFSSAPFSVRVGTNQNLHVFSSASRVTLSPINDANNTFTDLAIDGTGQFFILSRVRFSAIRSETAAAPTIASATTIAPTTQIAFVSGTAAIATITAPSAINGGGGQITLIPTGIFTTTTGGNIALASTAVVSKALIMTYDATTAKWYPSY